MSSDYISRLRQELLRAGASKRSRWRPAPAARGLRTFAAAAAVALVAVAVVLALPDGGGNEQPIGKTAGTLHLTYRVEASDAAATDRTAQVVRGRLAAAGVRDAGVSVASSGSLTIVAPAGARADVAALVRSGRLAIYDWERSVLGPRGAPAPSDARVTGGPDAGRSAATTKAEAEARAARRPGGRAVRALSSAPDSWFALGGRPAMTNAHIKSADSAVDAMTHEPIVAIELTARGQQAFATLTRDIARRGSARAADGVSSADMLQHFAIVIDDQIVSIPYIDFRQAPDGIDGSAGVQIQGGLTRQSAGRMAALLSAGPLPTALVADR